MIFWSVAEDLIYSFNKSKKYNTNVKRFKSKILKINKNPKLTTNFKGLLLFKNY